MTIAIIRAIKVRRGNLAGLRAVIDYIKDSSKTLNGDVVFSKDCLKGKEFEQMLITKKLHNKDTGRQYAHFIQSFARDDAVTPHMAYEIGQEFLNRLEKVADHQVVMAVHTNEAHLHIHYVINSVSMDKGVKWQCTPKDLEKMRSISDDLCRENNLSVIEQRKGFSMKYGEYKASLSWKEQLATDIVESIKQSFSTADFHHNLAERGIACDIGNKAILFQVQKGYCNLKSDRSCSNFKLMNYGDFSRENILNSIDYNEFNRADAFNDVIRGIGEFAGLDICNGKPPMVSMFIGDEDLKGKSWLEIEIILAGVKARQRNQEFTKAMIERAEQDAQSNTILATSMAMFIDEFTQWQSEKSNNQTLNEIEFEDDWER